MAYPTEVDAVQTAPTSGTLGGTSPTHVALHDQYRTALLSIKAKIDANGTMATQNASAVAITGGSVTGITDLTVADGGTGASTAAGARTNLDAAQTTHTHAATDLTAGTVATARLGSGTANSSSFLRGDGTWATPAGTGNLYSIAAGSSLATVQAAVNALDASFAGRIVLGPGEYDWASGSLTLRSNLTLEGYGANIFYSGTTGSVMAGTDINNLTLRGFKLWGPGQTTGTGNGISLALSAADNTPYIHIEDVQAWEFGGSGFILAGLLASSLTGCVSTLHGGFGFDITQAGFGTSVTMNNCFGNACRKAAYRLTRMTYCTLNSCATDDCGIGYELVDCSAIHLSGCGCEVPKDTDAIVGGSTYDNYFGVGYKVTGGTSITFTSCFVLGLATSPGGDVGWWFTGTSTNCLLSVPFEVDPGASVEAALKVDTGSSVTLIAPRFLSSVTGAGTKTTLT